MKAVNLIIVFNPNKTHVLMCLRHKDPYKGLYNFVGGKKEDFETELQSAYRELEEESGISSSDITIEFLYRETFARDALHLDVFYGFLAEDVNLIEESQELKWISSNSDFSDLSRFAGEGNIQTMMDRIKQKENL